MQRKLDLLDALGYLDREGLTEKGLFASWLYGYELLLTELFVAKHLSQLDPTGLALLLAGIVFEPRPRSVPPKTHRLSKQLAALCEEPLERIHKAEARFHVFPKTKVPAFALSAPLDAWMRQEPFHRLLKLCDVDEGEIVRYFRMTLQLLRQLAEAPGADARLRATATKAVQRINRDVIDAEAQLRMG